MKVNLSFDVPLNFILYDLDFVFFVLPSDDDFGGHSVGRVRAWHGCLMKLRSPSLLHSFARHRSQLKFTPLKRVELAVHDWQCSRYNLQETYSLGRFR